MKKALNLLALALLVASLSSPLAAQKKDPWLHVEVKENKAEPEYVKVNLPMSMVDVALSVIKDKKFDKEGGTMKNPPLIQLGRHYLTYIGATPFYLAAHNGDLRMLKGLIDQSLRFERDVPVRMGKISVDTPTEVKDSFARVMKLLGTGKIDAESALAIAKVLELALQAVSARDLDQRTKALEANEKLQDVGGQAGAGGSFADREDHPADPKPS
jgi:hypothetical protein